MFHEFKKVMAQEFEMSDIGLMAYNLEIEVSQGENETFISQEGYAKKILEKFMAKCNPINTRIVCGMKMSKYDKLRRLMQHFIQEV